MTAMMSGVEDAENVEPEASLDEQLVEQLMDRAKAGELKRGRGAAVRRGTRRGH